MKCPFCERDEVEWKPGIFTCDCPQYGYQDPAKMKIKSARITAMPKQLFDPMPQVYVTTEDGREQLLFEYYPDEISFSPREFVGLTLDEARSLKHKKDVAYLRS